MTLLLGGYTHLVEAPRDPPPLPEVLRDETPAVKLVYTYLAPYREVQVSVRQLEERLGISHRPAFEAMQRLVALGLLEVLEQPGNRPGRYRLRAIVV